VMAVLFGLAAAGAARAADAPKPARPVALFLAGCPGVSETALRHMVAVEIGERLITAGDPTPPNADRVIISCRAQLARLEAGDPASPRHAERTLALTQFKGDSATRALALAALELLTALDRPPPPPIPPPPPAPPAIDPANVETYQRQFVWFNDAVVITGRWNDSRNFFPYRGKYHEPLPGSDFYRAIDRPDLASRYRVIRGIQLSLEIGGTAVALVGALEIHSHSQLGWDLFLGGGAALTVGYFLNADSVNEQDARRLADEHNKRLKRQLGLAPVESPAPRPPPTNWHVSAAMVPNGAAMAARLAF